MAMSAAHDGDRQRINLESEAGASRGIRTAKAMPSAQYQEFRDSVDGMTVAFSRKDSITINPRLSASDSVRVIFQSQVYETGEGHRLSLRIIAADEANPGTAFRLNPDEICLIQKFSPTADHNVRIDGRWDAKFHYLEFKDLRFESQYVVAFTTDQSDVFAAACLSPVPDAVGRR